MYVSYSKVFERKGRVNFMFYLGLITFLNLSAFAADDLNIKNELDADHKNANQLIEEAERLIQKHVQEYWETLDEMENNLGSQKED